MALIKDDATVQLDVPGEPGQWIKVRPLRIGDTVGKDGADMTTTAFSLLSAVIREWSYDAAPTPETVALLDMGTATWLAQEVVRISGVRPDMEKKDSKPS